MEYTNIQDKKNLFREGFTKLAEGGKYWLMSYFIALLGFLAILAAGLGSLTAIENTSDFESALSTAGAALGAGVFLLLLSAIISLLALVKLKNGAEALSDAERDLSKGATGTKLMLYSIYGLILGLLILLGGVAALAASSGGGLAGLGLLGLGGLILILSAIGLFVGFILFIIFLYNIPDTLSRKYELEVSNDFKTAAIMFAIGLILGILVKTEVVAPIFDIIGAYFLYKASLDSVEVIEKWTPRSESEASSGMEEFTL